MRSPRNSLCSSSPRGPTRPWGGLAGARLSRMGAGRRATVALVAVLAAGCALTRTAPVKDMYLLDPKLPATVAKPHPGSVRVGTLGVGAPYRARTFVVRDTDVKYQSDFYNEFIVPPGQMLAEDTARALINAKVFADVGRPGVVVATDWLLDGFVGALYADVRDPAKPAAVLEVTYYLTRDDAGQTAPVWSKVYHQHVVMSTTAAKDYVTALNTALSEILGELVRDLATLALPKSPSG
jgi:cholesterol transport system auxiliary component